MNKFETFLGKKVAIITGGTAGHVHAATNLAIYLNATIYINEDGVKFCNYEPKILFTVEKSLFQMITLICYFLFELNQYDIVIGFGAFMCLPALIAAKLLRKETYTHEQNSITGYANTLLSFCGVEILHSFNISKNSKNLCGIPLIHDINETSTIGDYILVLSGSLGSDFFNETLFDIMNQWATEHKQLIYFQSTTRKSTTWLKCEPFFNNWVELMKNAKFIIARGGAGTLANLLTWKKNAIIIPLPHSRRNHQLYNANLSGYKVIEQKNATYANISSALNEYMELKEFININNNMSIFIIPTKNDSNNDSNNN